MRTLLISALALAPLLASAQIYKCTGLDGKVNLTDRPCPASEQSESISIPPPPETGYERIMRESRESRAASKASIAKSEEELRRSRMARESRYRGRQERAGLVMGMTSGEVLELDVWGLPDDKNITDTAKTRREQWIYRVDIDNDYERMYLYFTNGVLTTVQD